MYFDHIHSLPLTLSFTSAPTHLILCSLKNNLNPIRYNFYCPLDVRPSASVWSAHHTLKENLFSVSP